MASRFTSRFLPLCSHLLRGSLCAVVLLFVLAHISAQTEFIAAHAPGVPHDEALAMLRRARTVFPFDHRLRRGPVDYLIITRWKGSRPMTEAEVKGGLEEDFFALDLHRMLAGLYYEDHNLTGMNEEMAIFRAFMPHGQPSIIVNANPDTD